MLKATECIVCFSEYDRNEHFPVVSECGHTLCRSCSPNVEICPTCRSYTFDNQKLTKNYAVLNIVEEMRAGQHLSLPLVSKTSGASSCTAGGLVVQIEAISPMRKPKKKPSVELDKPATIKCASKCSLM